jgi:microcystin degradation protein MlrC
MAEKKKLRIAFGRFMQESNSFSPVDSHFGDFKYSEGEELMERCEGKRKWEIDGFLRNLELSGFMRAVKRCKNKVEAVPLFSAWAITGGPLVKTDFEEVCERFRLMLRNAGHLDGVFLAIHGALDVRDIVEPEARLFEIVREELGSEVKLAISIDLHAILSRPKVDPVDIICGYRTNPHRDFASTGYRAGKLLIQTLLGEVKPTYAWRSLPMMAGGGAGVDFMKPMTSVFKRMTQMERKDGALTCTTFICHPFIKHRDIGWAVYVMTDNDQGLADKLADELADRCWAVRKERYDGFMRLDGLVEKVKKAYFARKLGTITISDSSDVVAAGSTGENTKLLKALLENAAPMLCYVPLRDPVVVEELWSQSIGTDCKIGVGGKLQPDVNEQLEVAGKIIIKKETQSFGRAVVLDLGHVKLVLTAGSALALKPAFYSDLGLNAWAPDITVVKSFFHFRLFYLFISRKSFYVQTGGITDIDVAYGMETNDPVYPNVELDSWQEIDAKRRGV